MMIGFQSFTPAAFASCWAFLYAASTANALTSACPADLSFNEKLEPLMLIFPTVGAALSTFCPSSTNPSPSRVTVMD